MKKSFFRVLLLSLTVLFTCAATAQILPTGIALRVVIIRHGEKPKNGENLNCKGLNRALMLPAVLDTVTGKPNYTYVPKMSTGTKTSSVRMFQTVTPFAVRDTLTINSYFGEKDSSKAAADVRTKRGVVLMVWEHSNIPPLARELVKKAHAGIIPPWEKDDFDSIWIIDFALSGNKLKFVRFTTEQENLTPPDTCN